jgi:exodeoxyribonuclease-3
VIRSTGVRTKLEAENQKQAAWRARHVTMVERQIGTKSGTGGSSGAPYLRSRLDLRFKHWDPAFLAYCKQLETRKPVIFCGDLNVAHTEMDLANPGPNRGKKGFTDEERKGFENFVAAGFVDTFRIFKQGNGYYTWWSNFANARARNIGWRIDYVLVSSAVRSAVKAADIYPAVIGSDHDPPG